MNEMQKKNREEGRETKMRGDRQRRGEKDREGGKRQRGGRRTERKGEGQR